MDNENKESREDSGQDDIVLRVTAHYVEEVQAGHKPAISDYVSRYPQYADAIAAFIAYYQIVELPSTQLTGSPENTGDTGGIEDTGEFTDDFHIAIESAWQRVLSPEIVPEAVGGEEIDHMPEIGEYGEDEDVVYGQTLQSLFMAAKQQRLSLSQLAAYVDISEDIVMLLEQPAVLPGSIPTELYRRLAATLHQPMRTVRSSSGIERRQRVAEHPGEYDVEDIGNTENPGDKRDAPRLSQKVSFREAVDSSEKLSAEQKRFWRDVLAKEQM